MSATCERCDGSGKVSERIDHPDEWRDIGHGLQIGGGTSWTSDLCECRKKYAPRAGEAVWWSSEEVFRAECEASIFQHTVTIVVKAEVPIDKDNYRVHRHGNRYYPTFVDVGDETLFPEEARALASALIAAADKCDQIDKPDVGPSGEWIFPAAASPSPETDEA
jgi:hypothetical protein